VSRWSFTEVTSTIISYFLDSTCFTTLTTLNKKHIGVETQTAFRIQPSHAKLHNATQQNVENVDSCSFRLKKNCNFEPDSERHDVTLHKTCTCIVCRKF